jgi:hypothetical protein
MDDWAERLWKKTTPHRYDIEEHKIGRWVQVS